MHFFPTQFLQAGLPPRLGDVPFKADETTAGQDFFQVLSTQTQKVEPAPSDQAAPTQQAQELPATQDENRPQETPAPEQSSTHQSEHQAHSPHDPHDASQPHAEQAAHAEKSAESAPADKKNHSDSKSAHADQVSEPPASHTPKTDENPLSHEAAALAAVLERLVSLLKTRGTSKAGQDNTNPQSAGQAKTDADPVKTVALALRDLAQSLKKGEQTDKTLQTAQEAVQKLRAADTANSKELSAALESLLRKIKDTLESSGKGHQFATSGKAQGADAFMRELDALLAKITPLAQPQETKPGQGQKPVQPSQLSAKGTGMTPADTPKTNSAPTKSHDSHAEAAAAGAGAGKAGFQNTESLSSNAQPKTEMEPRDPQTAQLEKKTFLVAGHDGERPYVMRSTDDGLSGKGKEQPEAGPDLSKKMNLFSKSSTQEGTGFAVHAPHQQTSPTPSMRQGALTPRSAEVFRQVESGAFTNLGQGTKQLVLRLDPAELGQVSVILQVRGKEVHALLRTSTEEASQALSEQLGQLRSHLESQGLKVSKLEVQTSLPDAQSQWQGAQQHNRYQENRELAMSAQRWRTLGRVEDTLAQDVQSPPYREKNSHNSLDIFA